ncbi:MAG TPA: serine hydrolase domain-containing protein [Chloroflexia bacterium]
MVELADFDAARLARAGAVAGEAVAAGVYGGVVVAVGNPAGTLWMHTAAESAAVDLDTIFPVASVTKPIVALAVMQLAEAGRLLLNDPVARVIPEFGQQGKDQITVWHLLTHTSGLPDDLDDLFAQRAPATAFLRAACERGVRFAPGSHYAYCNVSFVVLGELIARLSGQPYPDYLRDHIFAPAGMASTGFDPADRARTAAVVFEDGPEEQAYFRTLAAPYGGLWTTANDLLAFGRALLSGGPPDAPLLSPAALAAMTRVQPGLTSFDTGKPVYAALGWGKRSPMGVLLASDASFGHGGSTGAFLWIDPVPALMFVFLAAPLLPGDPDTDRQRDAQRALNAVYGALRAPPSSAS